MKNYEIKRAFKNLPDAGLPDNEQVVNSGESIRLITKRLYLETEKHFGVKPHSVEHALRTLIGTCWAHGGRDTLSEIAGRVLTHAPSSAKFIDMIAAYNNDHGIKKGELIVLLPSKIDLFHRETGFEKGYLSCVYLPIILLQVAVLCAGFAKET